MPAAAFRPNEADRLAALRNLEILDTAPEARFDRIAWMARVYFQAPIALISLVDRDRQWFKSCFGILEQQTELEASLCSHVVAAERPIVVSDARIDPRFHDSRLVTGPPHIRFYAGVPVREPDGHIVGALSVIDTVTRELEDFDLTVLVELGSIVEHELASADVTSRQAGQKVGDAAGFDSGDSLVVVDHEGRVLSTNKVFEAMTGYTLAEIAGTPAQDLISEQGLIAVRQALVEQAGTADSATLAALPGWTTTHEAEIRCKDGSRRPVDSTIVAFQRRHQPVFMVSIRDATGRKQAERANLDALAAHRMANIELDRLNRLKSEFIAIVSHEFRTALTGIQAFSELIRDGDLSAAEVRDFANDINNDAVRLSRMITDLLSLEKMESGQMPLRLEQVDLDTTVAEMVWRSRHISALHQFTFDPGGIAEVAVDRDKVTQALTNLLSNAVKYSPNGGEIVVSTRRVGAEAQISVADQGAGVAEDELERIFDRYHRIERGVTKTVPGIGLGLPIVREIARLHGGHAWAERRPEGGTVFHLRIPLRPGA